MTQTAVKVGKNAWVHLHHCKSIVGVVRKVIGSKGVMH